MQPINIAHFRFSFSLFLTLILRFLFNFLIEICRAILRRGFAFSASIKNPPLLKSRNIQSQTSITANVPVPMIGSTHQPVITSLPQQTVSDHQSASFHMKDASKFQQQQQQPHYHHSPAQGTTAGAGAGAGAATPKQVQQKLSNESIHDLAGGASHSQQTKSEHIV